MKYRILSPDNLPICSDEPKVNTQAKVIDYILRWARKYEHQGYYLTAHRERIHWLELPYRVPIVRWGIKGKITKMNVARVGYEATPNKLEQTKETICIQH
jgi:hypothetical protein